MNCCNDYCQCTQGPNCPIRSTPVTGQPLTAAGPTPRRTPTHTRGAGVLARYAAFLAALAGLAFAISTIAGHLAGPTQ